MSNTAAMEQERTAEWSKALPASGDRSAWTDQEANLIEAMGLVHTDKQGNRTLAPRPVVEGFLYTCRRTGLDPLARQVYCIARWDNSAGQLKWTTQTSIDGFRVIAERHGKYAGQGDVEWLTEAGEWVEVFLPQKHGEHPLAARATIYRHDFVRPVRAVAEWSAYVQTTTWDGKTQPNAMWKRMGPGQLAKCAEALALRKTFPQDLSGLYTADEMGQAENEEAAPPLQLQTERAAQASATQQQAVSTPGGVDSEARDDWWRQITEVKHKGKRGSGDGGARDLFGLMYEAGVLGWPVEDGDPLTLGDALMQVSAKLPEERPGEESVVDADGDAVEDDGSAEDAPMVFAAPAAAPAAQQQVSEPLPPAPAGPAAPVVVDEAEPEVAPWTPAGEQPEEWVQPTADDDTPPF